MLGGEDQDQRACRGPLRATALTVAVLLLGACATQKGSSVAEDPCNPVVGAVVGGALGALVGGDQHRTRGAVLGAGVGALACVAINYNSKQTRTAEQVGDDYRRRTGGDLPSAPTVAAYSMQAARSSAKAGEEITVTSNIEVVPGRSEPLKELREDFVIVDPKGVERSKLTKTPAPAGSRGGAYVSTLQFTFPQGVPPGPYQVQSRLFVNGKPVQTSAVKIQVAHAADGRVLLTAAATAAPLRAVALH
ncbi:MAG: glycine zipper 2TM domain-containing protein [Burkholderiaceae bacterium]|nr:glycine zipper 2TM domain-containing protein [Burkholderiaceae bacterium]